jgi:GAF domain-containing protein
VSALAAETLAALLAIRLHDASLSDVLDKIVGVVKETLDGAEEVSVTLVRDDKPFTAAYTGQLALDADEMQYDRGYGPCIDAGQTGTLLISEDMREETRWPDYAAHVVPRGVLSSMSVPLPIQTQFVGALNCYARKPSAFSPEDISAGLELASHVAVAVANAVSYADTARLAEDMRAAMASRAAIEQAIGVIMAQNRCDAAKAFAVLRKASQNRNLKLRDVAKDIVRAVAEPAKPSRR